MFIKFNSFRFAFFGDSDQNPEIPIDTYCHVKPNESQPLPQQLRFSDGWEKFADLLKRTFKYASDKAISIYREDQVEQCIKACNPEAVDDKKVVEVLSSEIDVFSGVIEGGFTVWDGTRHLLNFLVNEDVVFRGKHVLDLGCGAGLLGIHALLSGAEFVLFQEFNQCVLRAWTINNVKIQPSVQGDQVDFWSGDWDDLADIWASLGKQFDIILTTETIYRCELYPKLLKVFKSVAAPNCQIYVVGKLVYCGNDGTFEDFCNFVDKGGGFSSRKVQIESKNTCYGCLVMTRSS
ncbi:hypothetical protein Aperf_G00000132768 [Anoplocephala perfoliata]